MKVLSKKRAKLVGILIIVAYSMLTYSATGSRVLGFLTDVLSGLAVIGIPILLYPVFYSSNKKPLHYTYIISRFFEGLLMIIGGVAILFTEGSHIRDVIYSNFHIWFFIVGALSLYALFYITESIPRFISIWGFIATVVLMIITVLGNFGIESVILNVLLAPMILNEVFLAFWLIIKGFKIQSSGSQY